MNTQTASSVDALHPFMNVKHPKTVNQQEKNHFGGDGVSEVRCEACNNSEALKGFVLLSVVAVCRNIYSHCVPEASDREMCPCDTESVNRAVHQPQPKLDMKTSRNFKEECFTQTSIRKHIWLL